MKHINTFDGFNPLFEMKEKTRKKLEILTAIIRRRMAANPLGLIISDVPEFLRGAIITGIQFKVIRKYKDDKGITRLLLIDADNEFSIYDAVRKFTKPGDSPIPKENRVFGKNKHTDSTDFLFTKADLTKVARVMPNSPYWLDKIAQVKIGDIESLLLVKDELYEHEDYLQATAGYIKKASDPSDSPIPNKSNYGKSKPNTSNFLLDKADFKRIAKTLPKADYILNKINLIDIGDLESLHKLRDAVYKYYNINNDTNI